MLWLLVVGAVGASLFVMFLGRELPPGTSGGEWYAAQREAAFYRYRGTAPRGIDVTAFPYAVSVVWRFDTPVPDEETLVRMNAFEDGVADLESDPQRGFLMMVVTRDGARTWTWYARDDAAFKASLRERAPIEAAVVSSHEPDWRTFESLRRALL